MTKQYAVKNWAIFMARLTDFWNLSPSMLPLHNWRSNVRLGFENFQNMKRIITYWYLLNCIPFINFIIIYHFLPFYHQQHCLEWAIYHFYEAKSTRFNFMLDCLYYVKRFMQNIIFRSTMRRGKERMFWNQ